MSPFAVLLRSLRIQRGLRQAELADLIGSEQSYVSALEIGTKGPPTAQFAHALCQGLKLNQGEQQALNDALAASNRRISIPQDAPEEIYRICHKLRQQIDKLHPTQIALIETALNLPLDFDFEVIKAPDRVRRRDYLTKRKEATM